MARKYSPLYKKIVKDERDVVGHIAYALYKQAKIAHIEKYKADNGGADPDEDYLNHFHNIACIEGEMERYRIQATRILQDFTQNTLDETKKDLEKETLELVKDIKPRSFWYGVGQGALGSFALMLFLGGLMLFFVLSSHEIAFTVGNGGVKKVQLQESVEANASPILTENSQE